MRQKLTFRQLAIVLLLCSGIASLRGQSPDAFNYQGVARDAGGTALVDQNINVRIAIVASNTAEEYAETHLLTTSSTGLFSLKVGEGTAILGDFSTIDWASSGQKSLKTSIDTDGGTAFREIGTVSLLSVPYALHAQSSTPQALSISGNELSIEGGNTITLPSDSSNTETGKSFILITGDITDEEAQAKIDSELGENTTHISISRTTRLKNLDLSAMNSIVDLKIIANTSLNSVIITNLEHALGDVNISLNDSLEMLDINSLKSVHNLDIRKNKDLSAVSMLLLEFITGRFYIRDNQAFTDINLTNAIINNFGDIIINNNMLTTSSIDVLLEHFVTWEFTTGEAFIDLRQNGSAPPSEDGIVNKDALNAINIRVVTDEL